MCAVRENDEENEEDEEEKLMKIATEMSKRTKGTEFNPTARV